MSLFKDAVDDLFADPNLACDAIYRLAGAGPEITVRLMFWDADEQEPFGVIRAIIRNAKADVQLSQVVAPAKGDTFDVTLPIGGVVAYRVRATPMINRSAGIARLELSPV